MFHGCSFILEIVTGSALLYSRILTILIDRGALSATMHTPGIPTCYATCYAMALTKNIFSSNLSRFAFFV